MEQKDIDIYEILKDEEYGTELYTPICGKVWHSGMANDKDSAKAIWTEDEAGREHFFDKNESEDTLTFGNQYEIENEKFVTDQTFDLRISVNKELREATEGECCTFQEAYDLWEKSKGHPNFKPFDKVLARVGCGFKWFPAFFIRDRGESFTNRYNVLPLHTGKPADFTSCIPFEGHENFAFTDYDFVDLPF